MLEENGADLDQPDEKNTSYFTMIVLIKLPYAYVQCTAQLHTVSEGGKICDFFSQRLRG